MESIDRVECRDWLTLLLALPDQSVDMVFIDPPYQATSLPFEARINLPMFWQQTNRILRDARSPVLIFTQQPFTTDVINSNRKAFRHEITIAKSMPTGYLNAKRAPLRCHENLLVFARRSPRYWPVMEKAAQHRAPVKARGKTGHYRAHAATAWTDNGLRYPRDVWECAQRTTSFAHTKTLHRTQKDLGIVEKAIRLYSQPGWLIVDCFCGSGTVAVAARNTGRHFICGDNDPVCIAITQARLAEPYTPGFLEGTTE